MISRVRGLPELRRLFQIEADYIDMAGERQPADPDATIAVLRALGAELTNERDVAHAIRARRRELDQLPIQPVHVAWNGLLPRVRVHLPHHTSERVAVEIRLESGDIIRGSAEAEPAPARMRHGWSATHVIRLERRLTHGYHVISIDAQAGTFETFVIAAPRSAYMNEHGAQWGIFIPLYAICSDRNWGIGDYSDLEKIARWAGSLGAGFLGTLPLLATFLDAPFEPSPYSPASRLFWNELFVDVTRVPGWNADAAADAAAEIAACRAGELVDYRHVAALKRRELERALHACAADADVTAALAAFADAHPCVADYARFRAVCDRQRAGWPEWPERLRAGTITERDYAADDYRYHLFAQWHAELQLGRVAQAHTQGAAALYLDMPLGVNPDSYDVWRFRELFADGIAAGAPPDPLFTGGQNWGFRPLHPAALRQQRYTYLIETLRHHLRVARMLRLDHVMSLYRLFWVPDGLPATRGVYVRYPEDELFAVLVLESARHHAVIIGEDLGTVPPAVRHAMQRHRVQRMHVVQFEASSDEHSPLPPAPPDAVASLNTHDMPTFAGFWRGSDIDDQLDLGLIDADEHATAHHRRAALRRRLGALTGTGADADAAAVRDGLLRELAAGNARYVLVTLEDLWLEERPQNVPGTSTERPNWQRRARPGLSSIIASDDVTRTLRSVDRARKLLANPRGTNHG